MTKTFASLALARRLRKFSSAAGESLSSSAA